MKRFLIGLLLTTILGSAAAYTPPQTLAEHPELTIPGDRLYVGDKAQPRKAPKGYKPFYISTFARHGSRFHVDTNFYHDFAEVMARADKLGLLTALGREAAAVVAEGARRHGTRVHDLSPIGYEQSRNIAHRTYKRFKPIFRKGTTIDGKSSTYFRCIFTMAAFCQGLKECEPTLEISQVASYSMQDVVRPKYPPVLNRRRYLTAKEHRQRCLDVLDEWAAKQQCPTTMARLVTDPERFTREMGLSSYDFTCNLYRRLGFVHNFWKPQTELIKRIFAPEDLHLYHKYYSHRWLSFYAEESNSDVMRYLSRLRYVVDDIAANAEKAIEGRNDAVAHLRFTHDSFLVPLLVLMQAEGCRGGTTTIDKGLDTWCISENMCMAANIQFVFFRNGQGDILVQLLLNESDIRLPIASVDGFYRWDDLRRHLYKRLDTADKAWM